MQHVNFYGIGIIVEEVRTLPTSLPTALVFLSEGNQVEQTVNDKVYSGKKPVFTTVIQKEADKMSERYTATLFSAHLFSSSSFSFCPD